MIRIQQKQQFSFPWYTLNNEETDSDFDPIEYVSRKLRSENRRRDQKKSSNSSDFEESNSNSTLTSTASPGSVTSHLSEDHSDDNSSNDDDHQDNIYRITRLAPPTTKRTRKGYYNLSIASRFQIMRGALQRRKQRRKWKRPKSKRKIVFPSFELTILRRRWGSQASDYEPDDSEDGIFIVFEDNHHQLKANLL